MSNSWPSPRYDIQQTAGTQANPSVPNTRFQQRWTVRRASEVSDLVIYSGKVFCATKYGSVHAFDLKTGQRQWSVAIDCIQAKIAAADAHLFVATDRLRTINIEDGTILWEYEPDDSKIPSNGPASEFAPTVGSQSIIWAMGDRIVGLDKNTGEKHWHKDTAGPVQASAIVDDKIVVTTKRVEMRFSDPVSRGALLSLDLDNGSELWKKDLDGLPKYGPVIGDDYIFVSYGSTGAKIEDLIADDMGLIAVDSTDGTIQWHKHVWGGCPAYADGLLVQVRESRVVTMNSGDGELQWDTETDLGWQSSNRIVIAGENIFIGGPDRISAVSLESGSVLNPNVVSISCSSHNNTNRVTTYPAVTTSSLAFGTSEGKIIICDPEGVKISGCLSCGADLTEHETPSFCPHCGESV